MDFNEHLRQLISCIEWGLVGEDTLDKLTAVVDILRDARETGKTVYTFGNGGSHSTASHFACDLLKACGIGAVCISDMIPAAYAYMNDDGIEKMFDGVFSMLFEGGDVIVAFSCSGNSPNVIEALYTGCVKSVLFTGDDGGAAAERADLVIRVYNGNIRIQESAHLAYCHAIVEELLNE